MDKTQDFISLSRLGSLNLGYRVMFLSLSLSIYTHTHTTQGGAQREYEHQTYRIRQSDIYSEHCFRDQVS